MSSALKKRKRKKIKKASICNPDTEWIKSTLIFIVRMESDLEADPPTGKYAIPIKRFCQASIHYAYAELSTSWGDTKDATKHIHLAKQRFMQAEKALQRIQNGIEVTGNTVRQEWINEAKQYPITEILESYGYNVRMRKARCPYHQEKTPSCVVNKDNTFHCFGCGKHGDSIELYMHLAQTTFPKAVMALLQ